MRWPDGLEPECASIHTRNETIIAAAPERIWRWICRASRWPEWYGNCSWVRFQSGGPDLAPNARFIWKTFGLRVRSAVMVFDPFTEIGWSASSFGFVGYNGWKIEPAKGGYRVITEHSHNGPFNPIGRWYIRHILVREHQNWLEGLRSMVIAGEPD